MLNFELLALYVQEIFTGIRNLNLGDINWFKVLQSKSKNKEVMMEKVTQVTEVKSNFHDKKNLFSLTANISHYLPLTQYNAVNRLLGTETTKPGDVALHSEGGRKFAPNDERNGAGLHTIHHDIKSPDSMVTFLLRKSYL